MILSQRASRPSILSATKRIAQLMIHFQQTVSVPKTCGLCKIEAHAACAYDLRAGRRGPASDDSRISWLGRQRPRPARPRALSRRRPFSRDLPAGAARGSARAARDGLRLVSTHDGKTAGYSGDRLRAFLDAALERYPIERKKLVALGFSQGGVMAYGLALGEPERFAGLAVLSSWLPEELVRRF